MVSCGFLRKSSVCRENLPFSAISCALRMLEFSGEGPGESAKICGFLRKSAFWAFTVTLGPSPQARPDVPPSLKSCMEMAA